VNFLSKFFRKSEAQKPAAAPEGLQLPCRADLWCRKRSSISTMLDPGLYDLYKTGDDRIDDDWIVQSNPPCSFKAEFREGCDALIDLLKQDAGLHATKGSLYFNPPVATPLNENTRAEILRQMATVVRTAERELKPLSQGI
jgi:hypothetical protein